MFNIFKRIKPKLSELIPENFIDIHSHILPGLDDGSKSIEESILMISEMKKLGFSKIIATPHTYPGLYENDNIGIEASFNLLRNEVDVEISFASEYMIDQSLILKAEKKSILTLKDNYVLVEINFFSEPRNMYDIIFQLQINGYIVLLAHPERYLFFDDGLSFFKLKDLGVKFQLNLLSVIGFYGEKILKTSDYLIKNGLIDYVGSDIHNMSHVKEFNKKVKIKSESDLIKILAKNIDFR